VVFLHSLDKRRTFPDRYNLVELHNPAKNLFLIGMHRDMAASDNLGTHPFCVCHNLNEQGDYDSQGNCLSCLCQRMSVAAHSQARILF